MPDKRSKSKLYTRGGDSGTTGLFGGRRIQKDHVRVTAYGTVDELNAALGLAISFIRQPEVVDQLHTVQNELFNIGAELARDRPVDRERQPADGIELHESKTDWLEELIDAYDAKVPPLSTFVLPSGSSAAAAMHLARTVCRRVERTIVTLAQQESVNPAILAYVNRLCDLLFVLARYLNKTARRKELQWRKDV